MKKNNNLYKSGSFTGRNSYKKSENASPKSPFPRVNEELEVDDKHPQVILDRENSFSCHDYDIDQVSQDIDQFTDSLSTTGDKWNPPEVPDSVEIFLKIIESRISKYYSGETGTRFGKMTEEDGFFIDAVNRVSKLTNAFSEFPSNATTAGSFNRTSKVLQRAMNFMEEEFQALLEDSRSGSSNSNNLNFNSKSLSSKNSSFNSKHGDSEDRCVLPESKSGGEEEFLTYSSEIMCKMNKLATTLISAGYETECCQVYTITRRNVLNEEIQRLEFERFNMEDVQKMQWDVLEGEIVRWINVVKQCYTLIFPGERKLGEFIFSDHKPIYKIMFNNIAKSVVIQLLDFVEAVMMTKRSPEKLFKFLDIYESLRDLTPTIRDSSLVTRDSSPVTKDLSLEDSGEELISEIVAVGDQIGNVVLNIFADLEHSIKFDVAKTPMPGGAVHPLTRYVMNYLKYACEYKDSLENIFQRHIKLEKEEERDHQHDTSPFALQLQSVMDLLDKNLESKSRLYRDHSLQSIFLMNNNRYILQKVKGSTNIHQSMGDTWCRRRSTEVRHYHKNYQRDTWGKLLQCLNQEGLQLNGKIQKAMVKEKFKNFSNMFDEIHKAQSTWVVSDEQLLSELRVSISAVVIPAYRSFLGRFRQHVDGGRHAERYIRYQLEDIETLIEGLFDGNSMSMNKRK